jgi:MoaA/NifB/PqqE/SkfB family radical SAM enzyme
MQEVERQQQQQTELPRYHEEQKNTNLTDSYGRIARKLRISVTDRCNMRCTYCMPKDNVQWFDEGRILNYDEISRVASILADLGVGRIRLTGGEPLLRPKLENLISSLSKISRIKSISMTTNGLLLRDRIKGLKDVGLESVNISLDSFKKDRFKAITGADGLERVVDAIEPAGYSTVQINILVAIIDRDWKFTMDMSIDGLFFFKALFVYPVIGYSISTNPICFGTRVNNYLICSILKLYIMLV